MNCQDEINMEEQIFNSINHVKNISKKQATFARIYSVMKKAHKNLTENELENVIVNMVDTTNIEYHQRSKFYTLPDFTDDTALAEQIYGTDEDTTQSPSQDNENLIEETHLQDER